ncbi:hypothetical protein K504DRAFT_453714 [Pleomassaria siparia CBS 279.74]|uniref:Uncharacterized protein n=1 Tax=Pleomassaria siparia CBS 279.74 TaxID=1314801 RepID=A0A6G1JPQ6_9PLEO|nr:hypothetical protein K504DRAFT_453714 [Pleomassaria siparia CBS 279.74]
MALDRQETSMDVPLNSQISLIGGRTGARRAAGIKARDLQLGPGLLEVNGFQPRAASGSGCTIGRGRAGARLLNISRKLILKALGQTYVGDLSKAIVGVLILRLEGRIVAGRSGASAQRDGRGETTSTGEAGLKLRTNMVRVSGIARRNWRTVATRAAESLSNLGSLTRLIPLFLALLRDATQSRRTGQDSICTTLRTGGLGVPGVLAAGGRRGRAKTRNGGHNKEKQSERQEEADSQWTNKSSEKEAGERARDDD